MPAFTKRIVREVQWLHDRLEAGEVFDAERARAVTRAVLAIVNPKVKRFVKTARKRARAKRADRNAETHSIRERVFERARGTCEVFGVDGKRCTLMATDLVHLFGKKHRKQSERNCVAGCWQCHRLELTLNKGGSVECWERVAMTLHALGFDPEVSEAWKKVDKCVIRNALPAAPNLGPSDKEVPSRLENL